MTMRTKLVGQLNIRLSEDQRAMLELVANHYGLSISGALRMMIKREADGIVERCGPRAPAAETDSKTRQGS